MRIDKDIKLDFNDILIKPKVTTNIISRSEINPFLDNGKLPLFTAPMDTVVDTSNFELFLDLGVNVVLPRGEQVSNTDVFTSYSLKEFKDKFITFGNIDIPNGERLSVLIDTANGHIDDLIKTTTKAKKLYGKKMVLMVGNVANPKTYTELSLAGADLIRIGVGNGNACLTTQQLGIGYPMGSLIHECYTESLSLDKPAKIIADGGMKDYSDIIKALALGADYVMIGSIFNKCVESCGENYLKTNGTPIKISQKEAINHYYHGDLGEGKVMKLFRGMSTKEVQKKWGNSKLKTSEGVVKYREVEFGLPGWLENFESYLRSAMSYTNSRTLNEFINTSEFVRITDNAFNRFNK